MFNKVQWNNSSAVQPRLHKPIDRIKLNQVRALLDNCFIGTRVCTDPESTVLLKQNILTLASNSSPDKEYHSVFDLVYNKMPYVLFNNNMWYINMFHNTARFRCPIQTLVDMYTRYMVNFRKQKDFVLWY